MSDRADVLVIGSGASGAIVSRHLAERGFSVGVNPTSTICALALRTAEHIAVMASKQPVAA